MNSNFEEHVRRMIGTQYEIEFDDNEMLK